MDKSGNLFNEEMFINEILPFAQETFNLREGATPAEIFSQYKDLNDIVHETTKTSHLKGASTELGYISINITILECKYIFSSSSN